MKLFRVLPFDPSAAPDQRGGVLFVPGSTAGRIANPDLYREIYVSLEPECAIAETFGRLPIWHRSDFIHASGTSLALATYELADDATIFDLDSIKALATLGIARPSKIVTRSRKVTRAWARLIFERGKYIGARWWSNYDPDWTSLGLWDISDLTPIGRPEALVAEHPFVRSAAETIVRQIQY